MTVSCPSSKPKRHDSNPISPCDTITYRLLPSPLRDIAICKSEASETSKRLAIREGQGEPPSFDYLQVTLSLPLGKRWGHGKQTETEENRGKPESVDET